MTTDVELVSGRLVVVALSLALASATAPEVTGTSVNWDRPSFAILKLELMICRASTSWDRECQTYQSDAQHAVDAAWSCINEKSTATHCAQVRRELVAQSDAFFEAVQVAGLSGHRSIPFEASNPWLAGSIQQWLSPGFWSDPHVGFLLVAALALATITISGIFARWSAHQARVTRSLDRLNRLHRELSYLPSRIRSLQEKVDWFTAFFKVIDSGLTTMGSSDIPIELTDLEVKLPISQVTSALDSVLGAESFRGRETASRKRGPKRRKMWTNRTERQENGRPVDSVVVIDFQPVPINLRITLEHMWLGNPGVMSRFKWTIEATFLGIDDRLVRTGPNGWDIKSLSWCTTFDFKAWEGEGEPKATSMAMSWLAGGLKRTTQIFEGTAATRPLTTFVNQLAWLEEELVKYPGRIQIAEAELEALQLRGSLKWQSTRLLKQGRDELFFAASKILQILDWQGHQI